MTEIADPSLAADMRRVRTLATLLDAQFSVVGIRFGMDAIVGLIPIVGDTISLAASLYPLHVARKHHLGRRLERRMLFNIAADYVIGLVPIIGDAFDVAYRANLKNLELLEKEVGRRHANWLQL